LSNQKDKAHDLLEELTNNSTGKYDWYQKLGEFCLKVDEYDLAIECAHRSMKLATSSIEKNASSTLELVALLKDRQVENYELWTRALSCTRTNTNAELIVRSADALIPQTAPQNGLALFKAATQMHGRQQDADIFFRLGRIFVTKAEKTYSKLLYKQWLKNARLAFRKAIDLDPKIADYHLSLAGTMNPDKEINRISKELNLTLSLDRSNILAPYLLSHLQDFDTIKRNRRDRQAALLSHVLFKLDGVNCSCKISKISKALREISGVAFVSLPLRQPYEGAMLIDQRVNSTIEASAIENVAKLNVAYGLSLKTAPRIRFKLSSIETVPNLSSAVRIAVEANHPDVLQFDQTFAVVQPDMPYNRGSTGSLSSARVPNTHS
jgi:tetratricopeptide (TPR) repeat protein